MPSGRVPDSTSRTIVRVLRVRSVARWVALAASTLAGTTVNSSAGNGVVGGGGHNRSGRGGPHTDEDEPDVDVHIVEPYG